MSSGQWHVAFGGVGKVDDDCCHRRKVWSTVDELQHVFQSQFACITHSRIWTDFQIYANICAHVTQP